MALRISDVPDVAVPAPASFRLPRPRDGSIVELRGALAAERRAADAALLSRIPADVDSLVEMIRLRTEIADRDRRIATLSIGVRTWRERAQAEAIARRAEAVEAHGRERELVSLLHHQMQVADSATSEVESLRSRSWWHRLRA